jgi:hypothetical protein
MVRKWFALAGITALSVMAGQTLLAGCSSSSNGGGTSNPDSGKGDSSANEGGQPPPPDDSGTTEATCPRTTAITQADVEMQYQWKPPGTVQSVCVQGDIDKLKVLFAGGGSVKYTDIKTALGATCSACAFGAETAANWAPFVDVSGGDIDNSTASCFAKAKDANCGKARFEWEACLDATCISTECGSDTKLQACYGKATTGACKALTDLYTAACPDEQTYIDECNVFQSVVASCGGGPDAGIDAAKP